MSDYLTHEALDRASIVAQTIANVLLSHPAIQGNPEWEKAAQSLMDDCYDLYNDISDKHLV